MASAASAPAAPPKAPAWESAWSKADAVAFDGRCALLAWVDGLVGSFQYMADTDQFILAWCPEETVSTDNETAAQTTTWVSTRRMQEITGRCDVEQMDWIGRKFMVCARSAWDDIPDIVAAFQAIGVTVPLKLLAVETLRWTPDHPRLSRDAIESALVDRFTAEAASPDRLDGTSCNLSLPFGMRWPCLCPWNWTTKKGKTWVRNAWSALVMDGTCLCGRATCFKKSTLLEHCDCVVEDGCKRFRPAMIENLCMYKAFEFRPDAWSTCTPSGGWVHQVPVPAAMCKDMTRTQMAQMLLPAAEPLNPAREGQHPPNNPDREESGTHSLQPKTKRART